jgi:hypothetical protein
VKVLSGGEVQVGDQIELAE